MNCKPGNLARVIDDPESREFGLVDKIVRVASAYRLDGFDMWTLADQLTVPYWGPVKGIADELLRPIDGGESRDESIEAMRLLTNIPSEVTT